MADQVISRKEISWQTSAALEAMKLSNPDSLWFSLEEARMEEASVRDIAYNGDVGNYNKQIKEVMTDIFNMSTEDADMFPIVMLRDAMKMIGRLATVYKEPSIKTVKIKDKENKIATEEINGLYNEIFYDLAMREANQIMLLHNTAPVRIQFPVNRWGKVELDLSVYTPANVIVAASLENYLIPEVVSVKEISDKGVNIWKVENKEVIREIDYEGKLIGEEEENPYGVVRWAFARYKRGQDFWSGLNADEMVSQQKYSSALVSGGTESGIFNLFPIVLLQNLGKSEFKRSPRKVISGEQKKDRQGDKEPDVKVIDLRADLITLRQFEQDLRTRTAINRNLPRSSVGLDSTMPQSGYQEWLENLALMESRSIQRASILRLEREIFEILKIVSNKDKKKLGFKIPEDAKLFVDYAEDSIKLSPKEQLEVWEAEIAMGAKTVIDYMIYKNPDLDKEKAIEIFEENKKISGKYTMSIRDIFAKEEKTEDKEEIE